MSLSARFEDLTTRGERRSFDRRDLRLTISAALADAPELAVTVHDLSESGLLLETATPLATGEDFQVLLPLAGVVNTRVVWNSGQFYGCEFANAVARAAVSAALLRSDPKGVGLPQPHGTAGDLLSQLREINARIARVRQQLDSTIERFGASQAEDESADLEGALTAALPRTPILMPPFEAALPDRLERQAEPLSSTDGDPAQWVVIASLSLAGCAALIVLAALVGLPL